MFDEPGSIPNLFHVIAQVQALIDSDRIELHADTGEVLAVSLSASVNVLKFASNDRVIEAAYMPQGGFNSFRELLMEAMHRALYQVPFNQRDAHADRIYATTVMLNPAMAISPAINTHRRDEELEQVFEALPIPYRLIYLIELSDLCESWTKGWECIRRVDITPSMVADANRGFFHSIQLLCNTHKLVDAARFVPEFAMSLVHAIFGADGFDANRATISELHDLWLGHLSSHTMPPKERQLLVNTITVSYPDSVVRPFLAKLKAAKKIRLRNELTAAINRRNEKRSKPRPRHHHSSRFDWDEVSP